MVLHSESLLLTEIPKTNYIKKLKNIKQILESFLNSIKINEPQLDGNTALHLGKESHCFTE